MHDTKFLFLLHIEAVERKYVKKGQRLLFCGPDLISLGSRCIDLQRAFDALHGTVQGKLYFKSFIPTIFK